MGITVAVILMGLLGLIVGVGLAIASKVFYVYVDPKILAVEAALPGANCGGCGMAGCSANAEAIVAGKQSASSCVAAGSEVAQAIAAILGVSVEAREPDVALPGCTYGVTDADTKFVYDGMNDCRAAALLSGGMKVCRIGCLGLGTCAKVCPFNAITMSAKGLPVVDEKRCTGCGTCERACPKHIITLSSVTRRIIKEYTTEDCTTPCQRACPAGINISGYIGAVARGDHEAAVRIIKERNPFPAVIGRICPRPCEQECRRQYVDEPVAINFIKRYAADVEMASGTHVMPYKAPQTGHRAAVIGGGVEGLSAAFFTARLGHAVTVYEAAGQMGGLLRSAIARYRLPQSVLDWDIEGISRMGVAIETGKSLGVDLDIPGLLSQGFEAVFLAVGGWDSRLARTGGRGEHPPVPGCHLLIDVAKAGSQGYPPVQLSGHVVIIGNANLTPEMVQRCKALGAQTVTVLVREPAATGLDKLPTEVRFNQVVSRLLGRDRQLTDVAIQDLASGQIQSLKADHLIFAAGRVPELIFIPGPAADEPDAEKQTSDQLLAGVAWQAVAPYKRPAYHEETGLLAKGDPLTDMQAAIKAIAAGRRAAVSIHNVLNRVPLNLPDNVVTPATPIQNVHRVPGVSPIARTIMPLADASQVWAGREVEKGFTAAEAHAEAERCLQCGLICYLHQPQTAIAATGKTAAGSTR